MLGPGAVRIGACIRDSGAENTRPSPNPRDGAPILGAENLPPPVNPPDGADILGAENDPPPDDPLLKPPDERPPPPTDPPPPDPRAASAADGRSATLRDTTDIINALRRTEVRSVDISFTSTAVAYSLRR
jgi:hypothetical protein